MLSRPTGMFRRADTVVPMIPVDEFRTEARTWLAEHATPRTAEGNPAAVFAEHPDEEAHVERSKEWQRRLHDAGWAGLTWPEQYGGRGLTPSHQIVWAEEAADFDIPTAIFSIGLGMAGPTLIVWGTEQQKDRWLPPMLLGDEIWCQLFSEPDAGSDVAAVRTRAVLDGEEYVVNGQKVWTSGAHYSKWGMLLARTDPDVPKHAGLTYLIIDMDQPGVEVRPLRQMTGGANFNEVFFHDARVPQENVVGGPGMGWNVAITTLMNERTSIGALSSLESQSADTALLQLMDAVAEATGAQQTPVMRARLADLRVRMKVLEFHAARIVARLAQGEIPTAEGSAAKLMLSDLLTRFATWGIDAQGPYGTLDGADALADGSWAGAFLGAPGVRIAGGTDEIMRNIIGERVLDLPREPRVGRDLPFSGVADG